MKNLAGLMKQAQQMQSKMEEMQSALESTEMTGESGAGMVKVTLNGKGDLRRIAIDKQAISPDDADLLQDLIVAAHQDAKGKIEAFAAEKMREATGGLQLPAGMKLPF